MAKGKKVDAEEKVASNVNCSVRSCTCEHPYQDRRYGTGKRLFNKARGKSGTGTAWRCSVCGLVK